MLHIFSIEICLVVLQPLAVLSRNMNQKPVNKKNVPQTANWMVNSIITMTKQEKTSVKFVTASNSKKYVNLYLLQMQQQDGMSGANGVHVLGHVMEGLHIANELAWNQPPIVVFCLVKDHHLKSFLVTNTFHQGQIWAALDGCEVCQCVTGSPVCKKICEIPECAPNEKLVYQEHNKCCPKCHPITETTCGLHKTWDYLQDSSGNCQSENKLHLTYCSGGCGDSMTYPMLSDSPVVKSNNNCKSCVGNVAQVREAIVTCIGQMKKTMYYPEFWCCKCTECKI